MNWTDDEFSTLTRRSAAISQYTTDQCSAEILALQMLHRDRVDSGDDRRICLECRNLNGNLCRAKPPVSAASKFEPVKTVLWRCDGFILKGPK